MNDTIYYEDSKITVTEERIVTETAEYSTRDVNSVETEGFPMFWITLIFGTLGIVSLSAYGLGLIFILPVGYLWYIKVTSGCDSVSIRVHGQQHCVLALVNSARAKQARYAISQAMTSRRPSDA